MSRTPRRSLTFLAACLAALLLICAPALAKTPTDFGFSAHVLSQSSASAESSYVQLISGAHANSLRDDFAWYEIEPTKGTWNWSGPDTIMTLAAQNHLHVLMLADTAPQWANGSTDQWVAPTNPSDYAAFVAALAMRYEQGGAFWKANPQLTYTAPAGIEIWNEENLAYFGGGSPMPPATYTSLLKAAYPAVKAVTTKIPVILGGISSAAGYYNDIGCTGSTSTPSNSQAIDGLNYLADVYADGGKGYFDAVAWHGYNYWPGATASQMLAYQQCSGWSQVSSTPVSVRSLMSTNGDSSKQVWMTEIGLPSCQTTLGITTSSYGCVSQANQSGFMQGVMNAWAGYSFAGGIYAYDVRDDGNSLSDAEDNFGAVTYNGTAKPEYTMLQGLWAKW